MANIILIKFTDVSPHPATMTSVPADGSAVLKSILPTLSLKVSAESNYNIKRFRFRR